MNDSVITKNRRETVIEITGSENSLPNKSNEIKRKKVSFAPLRKLSVPQPNSPIQKNTLHSSPICQSTPIEQFTDSHFEFTKSRLDSKEIKHIQNLCQIIRLPDIEKHILEHRYIPMLQSYEKHYRSYCVVFKLFHCIVQTGSLIVPALLTIEQYYIQCEQTSAIFWTTWGISLMVGLIANYLKLFKIDKKHYTLKNTYYNLLAEGWNFISLVDRYGPKKQMDDNAHYSKFPLFCQEIDKMDKRSTSKKLMSIRPPSKKNSKQSTTLPRNSVYSRNSFVNLSDSMGSPF